MKFKRPNAALLNHHRPALRGSNSNGDPRRNHPNARRRMFVFPLPLHPPVRQVIQRPPQRQNSRQHVADETRYFSANKNKENF